ncbi:MAG: SDR family NAD(P)-dependent oxidoreductase [Alphaproteobacteria bacterium]|nr:SDR family NAD(P)-dependent oxidoreductase [Alphaproteobacteria bacterium]
MRVLVTGAAAGLGREIASQLVAGGAHVTAVDRSEIDPLEGLEPRKVDLADREAVDRMLRELEDEPPFDWVIHNAGISATGKFERIPDDAYLRLLRVNCETPMLMTAGLISSGRVAAGGRIVFISSLSHFTGYPGGAVYGASKDVLAVYAKSIRPTLKRRQIRVTTVFPGPIRTDHASRHAPPDAQAERRMDPADLAARIIRATRRGKTVLYPGLTARMGRLLGGIVPGRMTAFMRRVIFEKLERDVY